MLISIWVAEKLNGAFPSILPFSFSPKSAAKVMHDYAASSQPTQQLLPHNSCLRPFVFFSKAPNFVYVKLQKAFEFFFTAC